MEKPAYVYRQTPEGRFLASIYKREDCPPVSMATCLSKAINGHETAVKEKHVRSAIIGTYQERGASTFWECVHRLPLKENPIICWKFCHVLHKVLREGHDKVLRDSQRFKPMLHEHGRFWGHLRTGGYGELVKQYCALLLVKLNFHVRNNRIPGNLEMDEEHLIQSVADDENALFQLSVEMFDYLDAVLDLQTEIFKTIDSRYTSMTNAGQCRLTPLISCIQDSMKLYDFTTKILFRLHGRLSPDLLNGHRDRFVKVFKGLQKFYEKTMSLQYFKTLIEIQNLPKNPPNFLVQSELANYQPTSIKVLNSESDMTDSQSDTISEHLVSLENSNTNGSSSPDPGVMALYLEKERQVKELENEIERLKLEMEKYKMQARLQFQQLKFEIDEFRNELEGKMTLLTEKDKLIEKLKSHECKPSPDLMKRFESAEANAKSADERLKSMDDRYQKVKNLYTELRDEHVVLLRKGFQLRRLRYTYKSEASELKTLIRESTIHAPVEKELADIKKAIHNQTELGVQVEELRREKSELETALLAKIDDKGHECEELQQTIVQLKSQIHELGTERGVVESTLLGKIEEKCNEYQELQEIIIRLKTQVNNVESSKAEVEQELRSALADTTEGLKASQASTVILDDSNKQLRGKVGELEAKVLEITKQLDDATSSNETYSVRVQNLAQQLENLMTDELRNSSALLDMHVDRVSFIIKSEVEDLENPRVGPETGLRDFFMWHCEQFEDVLCKFTEAALKGFDTPSSLNSIVTEVQNLGHKVYFLLTYGGPLSRSGSEIQKGEAFLVDARNFGLSSLDLLNILKERNVDAIRGGSDSLKMKWKQLLEMAKNLGVSLSPEADAAEVLDQELHAMEQAIEEAAKKMEDILSQSRASHTGVQLEVNEKLIDSCSTLMNAIRILVQKSKGLQSEIVAQGRGTASAKEFYKRNNQWTEGLISAAKSVGVGATLLLESADKAVTTKGGGFEYLIASSQAIAASTIQLVVASQVRANRSSNNLLQLKQASTGVKTATAHVVATAKDCAQLIEESDEMDMTKLSPHQSKRMELELQAELLRQENDLEKSRRKLAALRQHHYHNSDG